MRRSSITLARNSRKASRQREAEFRAYESLGEVVRFQFGDDTVRSPNMVLMARIMIQFTEDVLPPLLDVLKREQPDYILHDFTCIWGLLAAEILAVPAVAIIPQFPVNYQTRPDPYPGMWRDLLWNFVAGIPHIVPFTPGCQAYQQSV